MKTYSMTLKEYYPKLMSKEILLVNGASVGAVATWISSIEAGLAIVVLLTALFINVRNILRDNKRKTS